MDNRHIVETSDAQPIVEQKDKKYIHLIALILTLVFALSLFYFLKGKFLPQNTNKDDQNRSITPTNIFICPTTEYVDCMPGPGPVNPQCSTEYMQWAQENCPGFKSGAL